MRRADDHEDEHGEESLGDQFWAVAGQLRRAARGALAPWDITPAHGRALTVLGRHGAMRLRDLSDHLRIAPRSTTEVADALEERGLVARRPDPDDRRATILELTDAGREVNRSVQATRAAEAEAFFGVLSATDQAALARILARLRAH